MQRWGMVWGAALLVAVASSAVHAEGGRKGAGQLAGLFAKTGGAVAPCGGTYTATFVSFVSDEGILPAPIQNAGPKGAEQAPMGVFQAPGMLQAPGKGAMQAPSAFGPQQAPGKSPIQGPVQAPSVQYMQKTIMVPTTVTEMRRVQATEMRTELRERRYMVQRPVSTTRQVEQPYTVMMPVTRSRQVTVPITRPVFREVPQEYTVMTTVQRVRQERYMVNKPVWREVVENYTVMVPHQEFREGVRTVCQVVQDVVMQTVCRPSGYWADQTVAYSSGGCGWGGGCGWRGGCGFKGGCGGGECVTMCTQKVWVPSFVSEQVPVTVNRVVPTQVPYQYSVTVLRPELRERSSRVCDYIPEEQVRDIPYLEYVPQVMQRMVRVCEYVTEQEVREVPYTELVPETRSRMVTVVDCQFVPEERVEHYPVAVPHVVEREIPVRVCRLVPQTITVPVAPACDYSTGYAPSLAPCRGAIGHCGGLFHRHCRGW